MTTWINTETILPKGTIVVCGHQEMWETKLDVLYLCDSRTTPIHTLENLRTTLEENSITLMGFASEQPHVLAVILSVLFALDTALLSHSIMMDLTEDHPTLRHDWQPHLQQDDFIFYTFRRNLPNMTIYENTLSLVTGIWTVATVLSNYSP